MTSAQFLSTLMALRELEIEQSAARIALLDQAIAEAGTIGAGSAIAAPAVRITAEQHRKNAQDAVNRCKKIGMSYHEMLSAIFAHPEWRFDKRMEAARLREIGNGGQGGRHDCGVKNPEKLRIIALALNNLPEGGNS